MEEREEGMYERARIIQDLCGSDFASDKELEVLSQEFYFDFGCHWTEILDKQKVVKMKVNAIRCKNCNTIIYSRAEHDFHWCPCGRCAVDGGFDYFKIVGNREDWEVTELNVLEGHADGEAKNILYNDWNLNENKFGTKILSSERNEAFDPLFASKEGSIDLNSLPDGSGVNVGCGSIIDDGRWSDYPSSVDEIANGDRSWQFFFGGKV